MSWLKELQRLFSPYEFALAANFYFLTAAGLISAIGHYAPIEGANSKSFLLFLGVAIPLIPIVLLTRCHDCGKSALTYFRYRHSTLPDGSDKNEFKIARMYRFWPERECSECGANLKLRGSQRD